MRLSHSLLIGSVVLTLTACQEPEGDGEEEQNPSVSATVTPGPVAAGSQVTLSISVQNFTLDKERMGGAKKKGHGHYHVYFHDKTNLLGAGAEETFTAAIPANAAPGRHPLIVTLHNNDHTPVEPDASSTVEVEVTAPTGPVVTATVIPAAVTAGAQVTLNIQTVNFTLDGAAVGSANVEGHGHYHVYFHDTSTENLLAAGADSTVAVTIPLTASTGSHPIIVTLQNNDHTALSPPVSYTVNVDVTAPTGPAVSATLSPGTTTPGGQVQVNIQTVNFTLDSAGMGGANVEGHGHYHVYFHDVSAENLLVAGAESSVAVTIPPTATAGPHPIIVTLHSNDHTALNVSCSVNVEVTGSAGVPAVTPSVGTSDIPAGTDFTLNVAVQNFELDASHVGGAHQAGHGHYHVYLDSVADGNLLGAGAQPSLTLALPLNTTVGSHQLVVKLMNNDHSPCEPSTEAAVTINVTAPPPPTVSVTLANEHLEAGGNLDINVAVRYFVLDAVGMGGANVDRHGHFHVYFHAVGPEYLLGAGTEPQMRFQVPADATEGEHPIIITLHNNDHTELDPNVRCTTEAHVHAFEPPPPQTVVLEGKAAALGAWLASTDTPVAGATIMTYGTNPVRTAVSSSDATTLGEYNMQIPADGKVVLFANKAGYYPSYMEVTAQGQNLLGTNIYLAENSWVSAVATQHSVNLDAPFACHAPGLNPLDQCIYAMIVGRILDDGTVGQGVPYPVGGVAAGDFTIRGPNGASWFTRGPYFLDNNGTPGNFTVSQNHEIHGGYFVAFVEIPQTAGSASLDFQLSIAYDDATRGTTRYFGPVGAKAFRPNGVTWMVLPETGVAPVPSGNVDFDSQVYPLFLPVSQGGFGCQGCHSGNTPAGGLNLSGGAASAYAQLNPAQYPSRVNVQNPDQSTLLVRPLYEASGIQDHPIFAFASTQDPAYQAIRAWIAEGAQRQVNVQPVHFTNDIYPLIANTPQQGGTGCRSCHFEGRNATNAPGGFFLGNNPTELYDEMVNQAATDPDNLGEAFLVNKNGYPERSLVLVEPLQGSGAVHPVKFFADTTDPRYQLIYRWVAEGCNFQ
ncbi:MAG: hypothetical protein AB2A00_33265 [Myxococcota bacterium]